MSGERVRTTMVEVPTLGSAPAETNGAKSAEASKGIARTQVESPETGEDNGVQSWRPLYRPPMAVLWILDDDGNTGEFYRLRDDCFTIGRDSGNLVIAHDSKISGKHCEIRREVKEGEFRWYVADLKSTNGTFVKIEEGLLRHQQEIYIGSRRYRFESAPLGDTSASGDRNEDRSGTQEWQVATVANPDKFAPSLVDLTPGSEEKTYQLTGDSPQLGSDAAKSSVVIEGDPFLNPAHCRFIRRENGDWCIEDLGSKNGTWMRISSVRVRNSNMIMIGEQRIVIKQI